MKKSLFTVATLCTFAGSAYAQNSVTLYGIVDTGIGYTNNIQTSPGKGGSQIATTDGNLQGSRWGVKGQEDLGNSVSSLFVLESGFNPNTGASRQGGVLFGRQSYVGLSSDMGTVTLGRQYDSMADYVGQFELGDQLGTGYGAHPGDVDNFNNAYRENNTVKYASPNYSGLKFGGTYSFGEAAGDNATNRIWSLGANYVNGPLALGAGYLNARTPSNKGGLFAGTPFSPVYSGFASADTYQSVGLGASYTIGKVTIGTNYSNVKFKNLGANGTSGFVAGDTAIFNTGEINFLYKVTPALTLNTGFIYTKSNSLTQSNGMANTGARYRQGVFGADYFLSKRTDVYFVTVFQKASGTDSTNGAAVGALNAKTASAISTQATALVGIRHRF